MGKGSYRSSMAAFLSKTGGYSWQSKVLQKRHLAGREACVSIANGSRKGLVCHTELVQAQ